MNRNISGIFNAAKVNMGGIFLDQALPIANLEQVDPFLLIHHWDRPLKGNQHPRDTGVGPHPHRGFSPVTVIFKGAVHHRDSRGNSSIVKAGGAQWMNSGMGIIHSERPPKDLAEKGGEFEIIQFWVNVPAKHKIDQPQYFPVDFDTLPKIVSEDKSIRVGILAGEMNEIKGAVKTFTPMNIFILDIGTGGKIKLPVPENYNAILYQLDGKLKLNGSFNTGPKQLAWFKNNGDEISIEGIEPTRALLLSGRPIDEEVVSQGPFVMNSQTEILEAMRDYQKGKMGMLIEEFD